MIISLLVTVFVEWGVVLAYSLRRNKPLAPMLLTILAANLITQSLLWIGLFLFFQNYRLALAALEIFVWLIESLAFFCVRANRLSLKEAFSLGLLVNLCSFVAGLAL